MARMVNCIKLGREAEALDFPPYPGELGKRIYEQVSKEAWQQWIRMQTMIINENRLNLADAAHRNADIGLFQRRCVWISERASRVLYKQETRALASGSQSFGHNLCPQGSLT